MRYEGWFIGGASLLTKSEAHGAYRAGVYKKQACILIKSVLFSKKKICIEYLIHLNARILVYLIKIYITNFNQ